MGEDTRLFKEGYNHVDGFYFETEDYTSDLELIDFWKVKDKLLELHFDIFNLIPSGLAIDINTIK